MRRLVLSAVALGVTGVLAIPALASQPVPVGVSRDSNGGVCVSAFSWVPQCTDRLVPPQASTR